MLAIKKFSRLPNRRESLLVNNKTKYLVQPLILRIQYFSAVRHPVKPWLQVTFKISPYYPLSWPG